MNPPRTQSSRLRYAIRRADWQSLRRDMGKAWVYLLVGVSVAGAMIAFASEPRRDLGLVQGRVTAFIQSDSKWPRPRRALTVRLDDGRTVVVHALGEFRVHSNERVTLREIQHLGWWRRTTFQYVDRAQPNATRMAN